MADEENMLALIRKIEAYFNISSLTANQKESVKMLVERRDIFVCTKTGSGKSMSYECAPLVLENCCVLIIAPLTSIMTEQCDKLVASGFNAAIIGRADREDNTFDMIENGNHDFVFVSPENAVGNMKWRDVFGCQKFLSRLKLIVVDEAHTILQWGESHHGEEAFRIQFKNIGELRSICLDVPMMALTATASPLKRKQIMKKLNFKVSPAIITDSADRTNIKVSSKSISTAANISDIFNFAIHGLYTLQQNYPRTIIFCCSISDCAKIYSAFLSKFGRTATIFNMYHSKTKETVKTYIRDDMNDLKGTIRILICTNAAGMGVNFKGIENILHFGLPRDMDTFAQQMGRAGRDGSFSQELILLKLNKNHMKKVEPYLLNLARGDICRHKVLCEAYLCQFMPIYPKHSCCDLCEKLCDCGDPVCPLSHPVFAEIESEDGTDFEREVLDADRNILEQQLKSLQLSLRTDEVVDTSIIETHTCMYTLTDNIITDVEKCNVIFSPVDVLTQVPCWSYDLATKICDIISIVFGDSELHNIEEDSESDKTDEEVS